MSLIPIDDSDIWLTEADVCERLCIEITSQISQRNKEFVTSERYKNLSAGVRVRLNQFNSQVKELRRKLETSTDGLTSEEAERRLRQVEILESKRIRLQSEFINIGAGNLDRENLLAPGPSLWIDDDYREEPSDREALLKTYTAQKLRRQNEKVIKEQDEGLDNLSKIISRQKDIAIRIHEEVENQNGKFLDLSKI